MNISRGPVVIQSMVENELLYNWRTPKEEIAIGPIDCRVYIVHDFAYHLGFLIVWSIIEISPESQGSTGKP